MMNELESHTALTVEGPTDKIQSVGKTSLEPHNNGDNFQGVSDISPVDDISQNPNPTVLAKSQKNEKCEASPTLAAETSETLSWPHRVSPKDLDGGVAYEWLKDVTTRLSALETTQTRLAAETVTNVKSETRHGTRIKPKVRDCNWEQFKNWYSVEESKFAIEALLASDDLEVDMENEQLRRLPADRRKDFDNPLRRKQVRRPQNDKKPDSPRIERIRINSAAILTLLENVTGENSWSTKPRTFLRPFKTLLHFHSKAEEEFQKLQEIFDDSNASNACPERNTDKSGEVKEPPHGQTEPLQPSTESSANNEAAPKENSVDDDRNSEKKHVISSPDSKASSDTGKSSDSSLEEDGLSEDVFETDEPIDLEAITQTQYEEIKCYIEFVRHRLLPTYHMFDNIDHSQRAKVRFGDLWSLFRPGELVFQRNDTKKGSTHSDSDTPHSTVQELEGSRLWRIYFMFQDQVDWVVEDLGSAGSNLRHETLVEPDETKISAYYIDYDGISYSGVPRDFLISPFEGEKEVTELEIYPVRFEKDADQLIKNRQERGQRFCDLVSTKYLAMTYNEWTLVRDPAGDYIWGSDGREMKSPEHISSDVIIDFKEAFQTNPLWKPGFRKFIKNSLSSYSEHDDFQIIQWSDKDRSQEMYRVTEVIIEDDDIPSLEWNKIADTDNFIVDPEIRSIKTESVKQKLTPEDLALLPSRLFVYSLRDRKFVSADIRFLKQPRAMSDPFSELKISDDHKILIKSIVQDHFTKKDIQRSLQNQGKDSLEQDFIRGKGRGLVILLHGAPGVGKTATAEAIAYAHTKPLFPITCGDLGIEPNRVEATLSEIFRLANLWDCVLLLDEAEIFLSHREKTDDNLQRNALVSIFLRTLEYYPGILFLTTNRVGVLDEALNSRVHVSINFPYLGASQTLALFEMNLKRSEQIAEQRAAITDRPKLHIRSEEIRDFAMHNFEKRAKPPTGWWNGRQIRNAFQIATSLAYESTVSGSDVVGKYLGREHFEKILKAIEDYENYRHMLFHKTDNELAQFREERSSQLANEGAERHSQQQFSPATISYPGRGYPRSHSSFTAGSSGGQMTPERQRGLEETRAYASTTPTREPHFVSSSPVHGGGNSEQLPSRSNFPNRNYNEYAYR